MNNFFKKIIRKFIRRKFIKDFSKFLEKENIKGRALLYYKTEYFFLNGLFEDRSHVNERDSYDMACVLNKLGFVVDILDRTAELFDVANLKDQYDLFIGIGAGDAGRYFSDICEHVPKAKKVLYALGPEPDLSNHVTHERHDYFRARHPNVPVKDRRMITAVDIARLYKSADAIITIGNEFSFGSYLHFGKQVERVYLSTQPGLSIDDEEISKKDPKKFLYFGGNGNIVKGLDLVLEVFAKRPDLELYIGAPDSEEDFNVFAEPIIQKSNNIHRLGFVDVSGELFKKVTSECGYVILPSASEGCATSVTTCMRRGLVPVVTVEAGIELHDFGYLIPQGTVDSVASTVNLASQSSKEELIKRSKATYRESFKYTRENFSKSFTEAVMNILEK